MVSAVSSLSGLRSSSRASSASCNAARAAVIPDWAFVISWNVGAANAALFSIALSRSAWAFRMSMLACTSCSGVTTPRSLSSSWALCSSRRASATSDSALAICTSVYGFLASSSASSAVRTSTLAWAIVFSRFATVSASSIASASPADTLSPSDTMTSETIPC